jgi:hypothetical protein
MSVFDASGAKADWNNGSGTSYTNIPELRKWDLRVSKESKQYASSSTAGGKRRIAGAEDFSGTLSVYLASGTSEARFDTGLGIKGGVTGTLKLWEDGTTFFLAPAYIEDVSYEYDIEGNGIVGATITFSRDGALTYPV